MPATASDLLRAVHADHRRIHGVVSCGDLREQFRADELQALRWVDRYKRLCGRPFPTLGEVLSVLLLLGYRQTGRDQLSAPDQAVDQAEQDEYLRRVSSRARRAATRRPPAASKPAAPGECA